VSSLPFRQHRTVVVLLVLLCLMRGAPVFCAMELVPNAQSPHAMSMDSMGGHTPCATDSADQTYAGGVPIEHTDESVHEDDCCAWMQCDAAGCVSGALVGSVHTILPDITASHPLTISVQATPVSAHLEDLYRPPIQI